MNLVKESATAELQPSGHADILFLPCGARERTAIRDRLSRFGFAVMVAADAGAAIRLIETRRFTLALIDFSDDRTALASIRELQARAPSLAIVAIVDPSNPAVANEALRGGALEILPWPFEERDLAVLMADARDRLVISRGVAAGADEPFIVAQSPSMRIVKDLAEAAARSNQCVVLAGEPGTGRGRIARMIHEGGSGGHEPLVEVNCATDTPHEVERRLFGAASRRHASSQRGDTPEVVSWDAALLEAERGGLFLTNLLELPARVQTRLARVLRDREVSLGEDSDPIDLSLRVIASVESSVDSAVADGRLRKDLFERLAQIRIDVPPFRRRREDLPSLAIQMMHELCESLGQPPKGFSRAALSLIAALPWRGNGDELHRVVEALATTVTGPVIELDDVLSQARLDDGGTHLEAGVSLRDAKARFERDCISTVLMRHHGRVGEAAKVLGIQRTNLYRKVRQLNVARSLLSARK